MIDIDVLHSFVLVGPTGERTPLLVADLDRRNLDLVLDEVANAVASRLSDPEEHQAVRSAAVRAFERVEELPGTEAVAGQRLHGDRLIRVFRHLAGEGPQD